MLVEREPGSASELTGTPLRPRAALLLAARARFVLGLPGRLRAAIRFSSYPNNPCTSRRAHPTAYLFPPGSLGVSPQGAGGRPFAWRTSLIDMTPYFKNSSCS